MEFKCKTVEITVRDNGLYSFSRQIHLRQPTNITNEIVTAAFQLFKDNYKWEHPIRSLGIRAADLVLDDIPVQLDLFGNQEKKEKLEKLDRTVDEIRRRFGYFSIQRAAMYQDKVLSHLDAGTHTIHPHSYFIGNWRDRFEKSIKPETERKLSMYFELYEGAWIPADSPGIWRVESG
mgnify:CR=1 FL=1